MVLVVVLAGCAAPSDPASSEPAEPDAALLAHLQELAGFPELRFETSHGAIRAVLYADWLPQTTAHIGMLAERGFYDDTIVHRVVDDFVIQGGDPTGTGEGGSGPLGLSTNTVPLETHAGLDFQSGAIGLARWTEDTGDSQWFIAEKPALHLSNPQGQPNELLGPYALFAQVFDGMDVVRTIAQVATLPNDRPVDDVAVRSVQVLPPPGDADLLGLIMDVVPDFEDANHVGDLEVPRYAVVGHPVTVRFTHDDVDCRPGTRGARSPGWSGPSIGPGGAAYNWTRVENDWCTLEITHTFTGPGIHTFSATDVVRESTVHSVPLHVLPWHDAYAPFTGTPINAA